MFQSQKNKFQTNMLIIDLIIVKISRLQVITCINTVYMFNLNQDIINMQQMHQAKQKIPTIFYGTAWKKGRTAELVEKALRAGFRGIDTACQPKHYNEPGVGQGIKNSGVPREELFIQTKFTSVDGQDPNNIPYDPKSDIPTQVTKSLQTSLKNLQVNYIDSLVLHGPLHTFQKTMLVWKVFEEAVSQGKVHRLGISNCYDPKYFKNLYEHAKIKPSFLQNRFYSDSGYDKQLRKFCNEHKIRYQSFWTLTANPHILQSELVTNLSAKYKKTAAQIFYRALTQMNIIPLIGTTSEKHMKQDLAIMDFQVEKNDLEKIQAFFQ